MPVSGCLFPNADNTYTLAERLGVVDQRDHGLRQVRVARFVAPWWEILPRDASPAARDIFAEVDRTHERPIQVRGA